MSERIQPNEADLLSEEVPKFPSKLDCEYGFQFASLQRVINLIGKAYESRQRRGAACRRQRACQMLIREAEEEAAKEREIEEAAKAAPCFVVFFLLFFQELSGFGMTVLSLNGCSQWVARNLENG